MRKSLVLLLLLAGCVTENTQPKSSWRVLSNSHPASKNEVSMKSNYVPSGTELIFTSSKSFNKKNNQLVIELPTGKRCNLSTNTDKVAESTLQPDTILTVVGYRGETNDLVLSEPNYQQYYLSCLSKQPIVLKRKVSSTKPLAMKWKKSTVEMTDLQQMAPLLKIQFIPQ